MNAERREKLDLQIAPLEAVKSTLEDLRDQEQEAFDNMPGSLQNGEKGEKAQEAVNTMDSAISHIEDAISDIETAKE